MKPEWKREWQSGLEEGVWVGAETQSEKTQTQSLKRTPPISTHCTFSEIKIHLIPVDIHTLVAENFSAEFVSFYEFVTRWDRLLRVRGIGIGSGLGESWGVEMMDKGASSIGGADAETLPVFIVTLKFVTFLKCFRVGGRLFDNIR